jgi:hypothetical protein
MIALSSTCLAIRLASARGTLSVSEFATRFGDTAFAIQDEHGCIEVHLTRKAAEARVAQVQP